MKKYKKGSYRYDLFDGRMFPSSGAEEAEGLRVSPFYAVSPQDEKVFQGVRDY